MFKIAQMKNNIYWLRNDLRLLDNKSLFNACAESDHLAVIYSLPKDYNKLGDFRKSFLFQSLKEIEVGLNDQGLSLYITESNLDDMLDAHDINPNCIYYSQSCNCLLYTSPSPRDRTRSRMPSSA